MCHFCDGASFDDLARHLDQDLESLGRAFVGVDGPGPGGVGGWTYSIGLLERFEHPELVVTGQCCLECAAAMLGDVAALVTAGDHFQPGDQLSLGEGREVRFGSVHADHWLTDRFNIWLEYYDRKPWAPPPQRALQVLWLDDRGRWQDDGRSKRWPFERLDRAPHKTALRSA